MYLISIVILLFDLRSNQFTAPIKCTDMYQPGVFVSVMFTLSGYAETKQTSTVAKDVPAVTNVKAFDSNGLYVHSETAMMKTSSC